MWAAVSRRVGGSGGWIMQRCAVRAGLLGFVVVVGYAVAGVLQILVWNPQAAVPGATFGEIHAPRGYSRRLCEAL